MYVLLLFNLLSKIVFVWNVNHNNVAFINEIMLYIDR